MRVQIPVAYGGSAVPPGGQPDILDLVQQHLIFKLIWLMALMMIW